MKTIEIHADSLEYTPSGLRTVKAIDVEVGQHNRIVIIRPTRRDALPVTLGAFARDSSFPNPAVLMATLRPALSDLVGGVFQNPDADALYQVYGHASSSGDPAHNKALSDRRARVVAASFTGDFELVQAIGDEEEWSTLEQQVMLRVLRCDPGMIDGDVGELTTAATKLFQQEYRDGVFHRHVHLEPHDPGLADDGVLGPQTMAALVEAYVIACSPHIDPARMHPTHPAVGCGEFNRLETEEPHLDRRVSLVVHPELPPYHDRAPCKENDHGVCPLDDRDERVRCPWYRAHVRDTVPESIPQHLFDLRWLPLRHGKIVLSALTSLPDGTDAAFEVFRSKPIAHQDEVGQHNLAESLSGELTGTVVAGVAQAVWDPPEDFELYDVASWLVPVRAADPLAIRRAPAQAQPPVFRVKAGEAEAVSPPPGDDFGRVAAPQQTDHDGRIPKTVIGTDAFGRFFQSDIEGGRPRVDRHPLDPAEPRVVLVRYLDGVTPKEAEG